MQLSRKYSVTLLALRQYHCQRKRSRDHFGSVEAKGSARRQRSSAS